MEPRRVSLALLPTPLHRLERVSEDLRVDVSMKRDDLNGLVLGGNKARKLEYLLAEALDQSAQAVVTCGGLHSNFIRQLGAACSMLGLKCTAAVMDLPYEREPPPGPRLHPDQGSPVIDRLLGVDLRLHPDGPWEELYRSGEALAQEYEAKGIRVYRIPVGGSSPLGAYAFYRAAEELDHPFDWIVTASSSGSTQTGLTYAFARTGTKVLGISCDPEPEIAHDFQTLGAGLAGLIDAPILGVDAFRVNLDFVGPGYGVPSQKGDEAIKYLASREGILLDPIYSGKAFAGLLHLVHRGEIGGSILFWHTGGVPALFAV